MATNETERLHIPYPAENDQNTWYHTFETMLSQIDTRIFANLENLKTIFHHLPTVEHHVAGLVHTLIQTDDLIMVSRTFGTEITVPAATTTLLQNNILGIRITAGAVAAQLSMWELFPNGAPIDAEVQAFGYIDNDWTIYWFNGNLLLPGETARLFSEGASGGATGKVLVTGADPVPGYLSTKLIAGANISLTVLPPTPIGERYEVAALTDGPTQTGIVNPNGVVTGTFGQEYYDSALGLFYKNIDGGTTWAII